MVDTHWGSPYSHVERFINITVETKATLNSLLSRLTVKSQSALPVTISATTLTRSRSELYSWVRYTFTDLRTTGIKFRCYHPPPSTSSLCGGRQREGMKSQTWMLSAQVWPLRLSVAEQWYYNYGIPRSIWWDVLFLEDLRLQVCDKIHILVSFSLRMTKLPHAKVMLCPSLWLGVKCTPQSLALKCPGHKNDLALLPPAAARNICLDGTSWPHHAASSM